MSQKIPKEQVLMVMDHVRGLRAKVKELNDTVALAKGAADDMELFIRAHCDHEWSKLIKGYEHEGPHCLNCGMMQLHQQLVEAGAKAQAAALAGCEDQANKSSTD